MESQAPRSQSAQSELLRFCPAPPDTRAIFKEMIAWELRRGEMRRRQRARIVRYACQLGLSAVEAGRLIAQCQAEAPNENPKPGIGLRLVEPPRRRLMSARVAIVSGVLLIVIWLLR